VKTIHHVFEIAAPREDYYLESLRLLGETGKGKPFQAGVQQIGAES
jgi:hypothetical protein